MHHCVRHLVLYLVTPLLLCGPFLLPPTEAALWPFGVDSCMYNPNAVNKLKLLLNNNVVGQDSAVENIIALIQQHIDQILSQQQQYAGADPSVYAPTVPTKPLVLSLHGLTGTGKSLTTTYIVDALLSNGLKSTHLYKFLGARYSSPAIHRHIHEISTILLQAVQRCDLSIFVFEEIHLMHDGILDALSAYMDYDSIIVDDHGASYSFGNTIWLFTSNFGGQTLQKLAYDAERRGIKREDIAYEHVRNAIHLALKPAATPADATASATPANNTQPTVGPSALRQHLTRNTSTTMSTSSANATHTEPSDLAPASSSPRSRLQLLVDQSVVSRFIPFFPLFKTHVKKCAALQLQQRAAYMQSQGQLSRLTYDDSVLSFVANRLTFVGPISLYGCKPIAEIVTVDVLPAINKHVKLVEPVASSPKLSRFDAEYASSMFSYLKERVLPSTHYTTRTSGIHLSTKQLTIGHGSNTGIKEIVVSEVRELKVDSDGSVPRKPPKRGRQEL